MNDGGMQKGAQNRNRLCGITAPHYSVMATVRESCLENRQLTFYFPRRCRTQQWNSES